MAYTCRICGVSEVDGPNEICELCAIGQDPYAAGLGQQNAQPQAPQPARAHRKVRLDDGQSDAQDIYAPKNGTKRKMLVNGNAAMVNGAPQAPAAAQAQTQVQVYAAGTAPAALATTAAPAAGTATVKNAAVPQASGVTKNISVSTRKGSFLSRWMRALFSGTPAPLDDEITMFQVFPDQTGTVLTALGTACDQVIVYGKIDAGAISENNDVEVFGTRDKNNNLIARRIVNKATGTTVKPTRAVPAAAVLIITLLTVLLCVGVVAAAGPMGVLWIGIILLCLTNLPLVFKVIAVIFGAIFSLIKKLLG